MVLAPQFGCDQGAHMGATLKVYKGGSHGICTTQKDEVNADLLAFIKG